MAHPNQEIIDAIHTGQAVEYRYASSAWIDLMSHATPATLLALVEGKETQYLFRVKPKKIVFTGQQPVTTPVREPKNNHLYFVLESDGSVHEIVYNSAQAEHAKLASNFALFLSADNAWAYRAALNSFIKNQ